MPFQKKVLTHFVTIKDLVRIISEVKSEKRQDQTSNFYILTCKF
jgi:hypothetical protein